MDGGWQSCGLFVPHSCVRNALLFACDLSARLAKLSPAAPIYFRRTCGPDIGKVERLDEVGDSDCCVLCEPVNLIALDAIEMPVPTHHLCATEAV